MLGYNGGCARRRMDRQRSKGVKRPWIVRHDVLIDSLVLLSLRLIVVGWPRMHAAWTGRLGGFISIHRDSSAVRRRQLAVPTSGLVGFNGRFIDR